MKKLSKKQMRIEVAQDVLKQLRRRNVQMKVRGGAYCIPNTSTVHKLKIKHRFDSAQNHIDMLQDGCRVCALGSLLISHVRLYNEVTVGVFDDYIGSWKIKNYLENYFTESQLDLIEDAFESMSSGTKAEKFGIKYKNYKLRLKAIMQNIVDNEGTFRP